MSFTTFECSINLNLIGMKAFSQIVIILLLLGNPVMAQKTVLYDKAGLIELRDPMAVITGTREAGDDIFRFSLRDVGKFTGHVCAGTSSGFLLTKQALDMLYPGDEIPLRGQISIVASSGSDLAALAAYIVRASPFSGDEQEHNSMVIDTGIGSGPGTVTLIFKRADTGKKVKAVFDKSKLAAPEYMKKTEGLKKKVLSGQATASEKQEFATIVQALVEKVIRHRPGGLITVSACEE